MIYLGIFTETNIGGGYTARRFVSTERMKSFVIHETETVQDLYQRVLLCLEELPLNFIEYTQTLESDAVTLDQLMLNGMYSEHRQLMELWVCVVNREGVCIRFVRYKITDYVWPSKGGAL